MPKLNKVVPSEDDLAPVEDVAMHQFDHEEGANIDVLQAAAFLQYGQEDHQYLPDLNEFVEEAAQDHEGKSLNISQTTPNRFIF